MPRVSLDGRKIRNWKDFHTECQEAFGFPDFYGRNMDAWIDCMSGLRDGDGMTRFTLGPDEMLELEVLHSDLLLRIAPDILEALDECVQEVNERYLQMGERPVLATQLR